MTFQDNPTLGKFNGGEPAAPGAVSKGALIWEPEAGPDASCPYDHTSAATPFGTYRIEWKSWKDYPSYSIEFEGHFINVESQLADAKRAAQIDFNKRLRTSGTAAQPADTAKQEELLACYERIEELEAVLKEASLQIEYLHGKFQPTGTGEAVLARIDEVL